MMSKDQTHPTKRYVYFVSYAFEHGHGNAEVFTNCKVECMEHIKEISSLLAKSNWDKVIVTNFILLREMNTETADTAIEA